MQNSLKVKKHFYGFDYLRAFSCLCVVAMHSYLFGYPSSIEVGAKITSPTITDIVFFNILTLAVPIFILISLVLYGMRSPSRSNYLSHRLKRLGFLYLFWTSIYILLEYVPNHSMDEFVALISDWEKLVIFIITGANGLYYFLFALIYVTIVLEGLLRLVNRFQDTKGIIASIFMFSVLTLYFSPIVANAFHFYLSFWNPINFIPLAGAALLIVSLVEQKRNKHIALLFFALYIFFVIIEWATVERYHMNYSIILGERLLPPYARLSIFFGSSCLVLAAFNVVSKPPSYIRFLSKYSLGIYCLHIYAYSYSIGKYLLVKYSGVKSMKLFMSIKFLRVPLSFISRIVESIVGTHLMKKTRFLSKMVS